MVYKVFSTIGKIPVAVPSNANAECIENISKTEIGAVNICFKYREHIACVWVEDVGGSLNQHLGVVDKYDDNELYVLYMKKFPDK